MPSPFPTRGVVTAANETALYTDPDVLPLFMGRDFIAEKEIAFSTMTRRAANGREVRQSLQEWPQYRWKLTHEYLSDLVTQPDIQRLYGFFSGRKGRFGSFFFHDPDESDTAAYQFGTGNGTATQFVVYRPVGAASNIEREPVRAFWNAPIVTVNGVVTPVTVFPGGTVNFVIAPANNAVLRWSGRHLHLCRFEDDALSVSQFAKAFWSQDGLGFVSDLP